MCASIWDAPALQQAFSSAGINPGHLPRIWSALVRDPGVAWRAIPNLPARAVGVLEGQFTRCSSRVLAQQRSASGETTKLLVALASGLQVEAVVMHYDTTGRYAGAPGGAGAGWGNKRATLCISSQVGCQMGCTFCATGTMGLKGSLSCGEIVEQLVHASRVATIRNVVFMGMGEPLANYDAVRHAVGLMADPRVFGLTRRRITISTVGVAPRIRQMAADMPGVSLALSLHAPNQELRRAIVPSARAYPLPKLLAAVDEYQAASQQRVFVEYVVLAGVNDAPQHAHELGALLRDRDVVVNLIPWNPVLAGGGGAAAFAAPDAAAVAALQGVLRQYGVPCTVRQEKGQDISGACGQLVIEHQARTAREAGGSGAAAGGGVRDIEELAGKAGCGAGAGSSSGCGQRSDGGVTAE